MESNEHLIQHLIRSGVLKTEQLKYAFKKCDRRSFVSDNLKEMAYYDRPLPIGYGQTISQPYTVAFMIELLQPQKGEQILDIGSGSGWSTALLSEMVGREGFVQGIERIPELVRFGSENIDKLGIANADIALAEPKVVGMPGRTYDRILVSASSDDFPEALYVQMNTDARLVIPVRDSIWLIQKKENNKIKMTEYPGFRFVPLITD